VQRVTFPTLSPFLFRDMARRDRAALASVGEGELYLPSHPAAKLPAVVIVEGLGGIKTARERAYGEFLARHGRVALVVDTFGTRGLSWLTDNLRGMAVTEAMFCADGYAALRYLRTHPAVDPDRISVMGFSYGGMIAPLLAYEQVRNLFAEGDERFLAHVSYYGCSIPRLDDPTTAGAPVLMMLGDLDRNVSRERSKLIADDLRRGGSEVELIVLPGVYHQWDGGDVKKRFVRFNLRRFSFRLDRDNVIHDERNGSITGKISRGWAILRNANWSGYHILRDERALEKSNAKLLDFLSQAEAGAAKGSDARRSVTSG
jgi:dienelactone hydrolase